MKKSIGMKPWLLIIMAAVLLVSVAVPAGAGNNSRKLYGDYHAIFSLNCATCNPKFDLLGGIAPYCADETSSTTYTWNAQGVYTFDGNGKFIFVGRYLGVLKDFFTFPFPPPYNKKTNVVLPAKLKCLDGKYTVNEDLTVEAGFEVCTVYANELETPPPLHEISNVNLKGRILDRMDGPILLLTDTMDPASPNPIPNIEKVTSPGSTGSERICGMTGTAIPIKGQRMKKGK